MVARKPVRKPVPKKPVGIPKGWLNVARTVTPFTKGDSIQVQVVGGYARKKAPDAGFIIKANTGTDVEDIIVFASHAHF